MPLKYSNIMISQFGFPYANHKSKMWTGNKDKPKTPRWVFSGFSMLCVFGFIFGFFFQATLWTFI